MTSRILFALFTVQLLSAAAGVGVEHKAAYDRVIECMKDGFEAGKQEVMKAESGPAEEKAALCHFWQGMYPCLVAPFDTQGDAHSSEILDFFRAYELQLGIMSERSHLCSDLNLDELKAVVEQSGIMERENLPNVEDDVYEPCAGEAHKNCTMGAEQVWEHHVNDLDVFLDNINCYDAEAKMCKATILQDMNKFVQAFKKHLQEKHGLFGKMVEEIKT